jgi:hypothetical protein
MKANSPRIILTIITIGLLFLNIPGSFAADQPAKLAQGMEMLKSETAKLGPAKADGSTLYFGATKMNDNFEIVEKLQTQLEISATLFVRENGSFVRVSSNIVAGGLPVVGTMLDQKGQAFAAISKGERFAGQVNIFGGAYDAIYEPMQNITGEIVGAYFVGVAAK